MLPDSDDRVTLNVEAGSSRLRAAGTALAVVGSGAGFFAFDARMIVGGLSKLGCEGEPDCLNTVNPGIQAFERDMLVTMAIGVSVALAGLYLIHMGRTVVTMSTGVNLSETPPASHKRPLFALTPRGLEF